MKGLEEFFGKLKRGEGEGLNEELKETSNILKKLLKLEKKEAEAAEIERGEKDKQRRRKIRRTKRKAFDLQNPFANWKKKEEKEEKDKGFPWGKILLALGLGGGLLVMFKDQILEFLGNWAKDRINEIGETLKKGALDLGKAITDFAWDKFAMRAVREEKMLQDIKAIDGKTIEQKIATLEKEKEGLGIFQKGRKDEITNQLHYLRSGEMPEHDWKDGRFRKRAGGGLGQDNLLIGDVSSAIRETDGSDTEKLDALKEIKGLAEQRATANDKVYELQQKLLKETNEDVKTVLIKQLASYTETLKAKTLEIAEKLGEKEGILVLLKERRNERLRRLGQTVPNSDDEASPTQLQKGGIAGKKKQKEAISKELTGEPNPTISEAQRYLATTDAVNLVRRQEGGLVLFQGHGDLPIGHSVPGTDGPGTPIEGKFKPTAEQYFVDKVNVAAEKLAQKEGVALRYQRPTGRYASGRAPGANWQMIDSIRNKGGSAVEVHFDAYGMDKGKMVKGFRGLLADNHPVRSDIDKSLRNKFGMHPSSGDGYSSFMLELDHLGKAQANVNNYARMLVDAVKGVKGSTNAGGQSEDEKEVAKLRELLKAEMDPKKRLELINQISELDAKIIGYETDDTTKAELTEAREEVAELRDLLASAKDKDERLEIIDQIVVADQRVQELEAGVRREIEAAGGPSVLEQEAQAERDNQSGGLMAGLAGFGEYGKNLAQYTKILFQGLSEELGIDLSWLFGNYQENLEAGGVDTTGDSSNITGDQTGASDLSSSSSTHAISGNMEAKGIGIAKRLMADFGIGKNAASGIVGNLMHESGLIPNNVENGKGFADGPINNIPVGTPRVGYGWGQWTNDRLEGMRGFLKARGRDNVSASDEDNYAWLHHELKNKEPIRNHWKTGTSIPNDSARNAATWFMENWERPGVLHTDARHSYAEQISQKLQKGGLVGGKLRTPPQAALAAAMGASTPGARRGSDDVSAPTYERPSVDLSGGSQNVSKLNVNVAHVRMQEANESYRTKYKARAQRPIVIVSNAGGGGASAPAIPRPTPNAPPLSGGGGLNMVQASDALHRINSGARF